VYELSQILGALSYASVTVIDFFNSWPLLYYYNIMFMMNSMRLQACVLEFAT